MRAQFSKLALAAAFGFAMASTFGCSSDDDGNTNGGGNSNSGGGSPVTGGADGGGNSFSQIYAGYYDDDHNVLHVGEAYINNGIIKMSLDGEKHKTLIDAGTVTNGIVKLELPRTIPDEYLETISSDNCTTSSEDIKIYDYAVFVLTDNDGEYIGELSIQYEDEHIFERIVYDYFSKAGKISCILNGGKKITNLDAKAGWNKIYHHRDKTTLMQEYNTNNILTKELKWIIHLDN